MNSRPVLRRLPLLLLLAPLGAFAHEGPGLHDGSFMAGLSHPMLGWDHVLAMVSIGILSAQLGGRANWTVPSTALTVLLAMVSVGTFTVYHGYAHGAEMPTVANPVLYALGFMTGTAFLHLSGVLVGAISQNYARGTALLRVAGAAIAGTGAWFLVGLAN